MDKLENLPSPYKVSAIVLGAGLSRRMGSERNKLLLPWQGKALIAHVVEHDACHAGLGV